MRVMLATICLNEMEWLPRLVAQHRDWPGLVGWVFVEGADPVFARTNPSLVRDGLSVDGTTEFLCRLASTDGNKTAHLEVIPQDLGGAEDQHKCHLRNFYLAFADGLKPDIVVVLDADEFYTRADQQRINDICETDSGKMYDAWMFRQRHVWRPRSVCDRCEGMKTMQEVEVGPNLVRSEPLYPHSKVIPGKNWPCAQCEGTGVYPPLLHQEVVGGYWQVPHTRVWRYVPGMRHVKNHNWPEYPPGHALAGQYLTKRVMRCDLVEGTPECVHLGFASSINSRKSKSDYYTARGEGSEGGRLGRKRSMYNDCRDAHLVWKPGDKLPHGAEVIPYTGQIPECFLKES